MIRLMQALAFSIALSLVPQQLQAQPQTTSSSSAAAPTPAEVRLDVKEAPPLAPLLGTLKAYSITDDAQFAPGQLADGFFGDFVLENDIVRAVIGKPDKKQISSASGGNLLDVVRSKAPLDYINYLTTLADLLSTESQIQYTETAGEPSTNGTTASVTLKGTALVTTRDTETSETTIDVETRYELPENEHHLTITTRFINNTTLTVELLPGDIIDWGQATGFVEGVGIAAKGTQEAANFVLGFSDDYSLGYVMAGGGPVRGLHTKRDSVIMAYGEAALLQQLAADRARIAENNVRTAKSAHPSMQPSGVIVPGIDLNKLVPVPPGTETTYAPPSETSYQNQITTSSLTPVVPGIPPSGGGADGTETSVSETTHSSSAASTTSIATTVPDDQATTAQKLVLKPGESFQFARYLILSDGDFSRIATFAYRQKGIPTGRIAGAVLESETDKPIADADVFISGGPKWAGKGTSPAFFKTKSRQDGTFSAALPAGSYVVSTSKTGRYPGAAPFNVTIKTNEPARILALTLSRESTVRVAVSEAETPTSSPLPCKITLIEKPGSPPVNWGFRPDVARGVRNVFFLPYGAAVMPITPGRYQMVISRGIEYDIIKHDLTVQPGSDQVLKFSLPHVLKPYLEGLIGMDAGLVTTASSVGYTNSRSRVIQAACEGVPIIVSGDYETDTNLEKEVKELGLEKWVRAFRGMRLLLHHKDLTADLFVYPLKEDDGIKLLAAAEKAEGTPPDVALSDLRKEFPNLIFEISRPMDPEKGYLTTFEFDSTTNRFAEGNLPPADFDAIQIVEGKKLGMEPTVYPRYVDLQINRYSKTETKNIPLSPTGGSFSRLPHGEEVGYPRMYLYTAKTTPRTMDESEIVRCVRGQHYTVSNGPIYLLRAQELPGGEFVKHPGDVVDLHTTDILRLRGRVLAAPWVTLTGWQERDNGAIKHVVPNIQPNTRPVRYPVRTTVDGNTFTRYLYMDYFVDAHCYSTGQPLSPVVPDATSDFGGPVTPYGWTAPIFIDKQGDGKLELEHKDEGMPKAESN